MRIIYVTQALPFTKLEAFIIPEIASLARSGIEVRIIPRSPMRAITHGDAQPLESMSVARPLLSTEIVISACGEFLRSPVRAVRALRFLLASRSLGIFLKNLAVYPKALWLAGIARAWKAKHIHAHWAATVSTMALIASEVSGVPWSFTAHRFDIIENNLLDLKIKKAAFGRFISRNGLEMARSLNIDGLDQKAQVIHMGVDLPHPTGGLSRLAAPRVVLCAASLLPVKGHRYLVESIAILRRRGLEISLWIAGEGELLLKLQQQVQSLGISKQVQFLGQLSHAELLGLYRENRVGIVALPSIDLGNGEHEGIPVSLIEAMSHEIPVVSTATGGIPELLRGEAGLLVPAADPDALADAIQRLTLDSELRESLARRGRARAEEEFAVENVVANLIYRFGSDALRKEESLAPSEKEPARIQVGSDR
jgi:glycosyltransferase involved in cell wall biosynthesis